MNRLREVKEGQGEKLNKFYFKGDFYNKEQNHDEKEAYDYFIFPNPNIIENFSNKKEEYYTDATIKRDNANDEFFFFEDPNFISNFEGIMGEVTDEIEIINNKILRENGNDEFEFGENYPNLIFEVVYV